MRANTEKFWFNPRMSGEKLASRGAGPHSVYRRESWVQLVKEEVTKNTRRYVHENDFQKKKILTPQPEGGRIVK